MSHQRLQRNNDHLKNQQRKTEQDEKTKSNKKKKKKKKKKEKKPGFSFEISITKKKVICILQKRNHNTKWDYEITRNSIGIIFAGIVLFNQVFMISPSTSWCISLCIPSLVREPDQT